MSDEIPVRENLNFMVLHADIIKVDIIVIILTEEDIEDEADNQWYEILGTTVVPSHLLVIFFVS